MSRVIIFTLFIAVLLLSDKVTAQPANTYSESAAYAPRVFPAVKGKTEKDKKKVADKSAALSTPGSVGSAGETMTVPVMVYSSTSAFVSGLRSTDFKAFIDGSEVEVTSVETKSDPLTIVLVLDMSPSTNEQIEAVKAMAVRIVDRLRPIDKVMVVGFSSGMKISCEPTSDRKLIVKAIDRLSMKEGTSIYNTVAELFEKQMNLIPDAAALILLTDGVDTTSRKASYESSLIAAEKGNVPVFPIYLDTFLPQGPNAAASNGFYPPVQTVGKEEYEKGRFYLTDLIRLSGGRAIFAAEVLSGKSKALDNLSSDLVSRYCLTFKLPRYEEPAKPKQLKIRVNSPNLTVLAKGSYVGR